VESATSSSPSEPTTISLRGGSRSISLEADGLRHPTGRRFGGLVFTAYRDITHLATSSRAVWIGTRRSVYVIPRRSFGDPHGLEHLVRALVARIARQPGGSAQLARMTEIEEKARVRTPLRATWGLFAVCTAVYAAQLFGGESVLIAGYFTGALAAGGDWWRVFTANLLHANAAHLVVNLLGLLAVGSLVERALGTVRTICVMGASGLGSMAASAWWNSDPVVGVSGILSGVLAALVWLELRFADRLPAWWRIPRGALFSVIALTAALSFLPFIAAAAHAGGFVGGAIAAVAVSWRGPATRPSGLGLRAVAGATVAVTALALATAGSELLVPGFRARHAAQMARLPGATAEELNDAAWLIAVDESSSPEQLEEALLLAERAVNETAHEEPEILDTLAEVHFQLGHRAEAVTAIDEAILRDPDRDYYREQRRRFLGERDSDDRPQAPAPTGPPSEAKTDGLSV
jgi:membrane associated rhomboid family serine protease